VTQPWYRLFFPATLPDPAAGAAQIAETLRAVLGDHGFAPYDPFPGGTGTPPGLNVMVRVFVAPPQDGYICVIGEVPVDVLPTLSRRLGGAFLAAWLTEDDGGFAVYRDGLRQDGAVALAPYLHAGQTLTTLQQALAGEIALPPEANERPTAGALPPEIRALAEDQGVKAQTASSLFERLSGSLFGKLEKQTGSSADQEQARAIFTGGEHDLWNTLHGQRVRAIAGTLHLPANWQHPSHDVVRDAYHIHRLRKRSPRMPLMPGDEEMLRSVPDALDYLPVYMGRP